MDRTLSTAFHLKGWAPGMALTALGPVFGLKGSTRGLAEASQAAGAMAWIRDHGWGPAQAREEQRRTWNDLRRAGIAEPPDWFAELARKEAERFRRLLLRPEASQIQPQLTRAQA
eukprot:10247077-Alexandrium_andersonii.AAC.1